MSQGGYREAVLLSDSPARLKSPEGDEELSVMLTHRQLTSLIEEILPSKLFADLVMMEPVEFTYRHPAGVLDLRVVPGHSLWRVVIEASTDLEPFEVTAEYRDPQNPGPTEAPPHLQEEDSKKGALPAEPSPSQASPSEPPASTESQKGDPEPHTEADAGAPTFRAGSGTFLGITQPQKADIESPPKEEDGQTPDLQEKERQLETQPKEPTRPLGAPLREETSTEPEDGPQATPSRSEPLGDPLQGPTGEGQPAEDEDLPSEDLELPTPEDFGEGSEDPYLKRQDEGGSTPESFSAEASPSPTQVPSAQLPPSHDFDPWEINPTPACDELLERAKLASSSTLILIPGQRPWVYGPQGYTPLSGAREPLDTAVLTDLLAANEAKKEALGGQKLLRARYGSSTDSSSVRCQLTSSASRFTASFRIPLGDPVHPSHLGLPQNTISPLSRGGLLLVASPRGGGRTTTAFVVGSGLLGDGRGLGVALGRPGERRLIASAPTFHFDVPSSKFHDSFADAYDLGASVLVVDDAPLSTLPSALELAQSGTAVVFTLRAPCAMEALTRALQAFGDGKPRIREVSHALKGVIYGEVLLKKGTQPVAAFERIHSTPAILEASASGNWELLGGVQGRAVTHPSFNESLEALVEKGSIDPHTAKRLRKTP